MSKPRGALGHGLADAAVAADDHERRAVDVGAEPALRLPGAPAALAHGGLGSGEAARGGEQEGEGEVGGGVGQDVGRDADGDGALVGGLEVDVVEADGVVGNGLEFRARRRAARRRPAR